jgi:hypothetical protein
MSAKLVNRPETIEKRITEALRKQIAQNGYPKKIDNTAAQVYNKIAELIKTAILNSPEMNSLVNGKLRLDFGLDDDKVYILPTLLVDLFEVYYEDAEVTNPKDIFGIRFVIKSRDEDDPYVMSAFSRANYISKKSGLLIQWLRWLLFSGSEIINDTYKVMVKPGNGRSNLGIMITSKKDKFTFSVDPDFSGVQGANFITRAIDTVKDDIVTILRNFVNGSK